VPLQFRGEVVGTLTLLPRAPGEAFSPRDLHLVDELARQAGAAVFAVRATMDLQHAHERLVTAGQEERRRLRRELHDVLGPSLAAMSMDLEVASALAPEDTARSTALLDDVRSALGETLVLVRRLAYGLYPPVLDQLGLPAALREHATTQLEAHGVVVQLDLPERLERLPAAAEVAAFHIATEAMTNVRRHSGARRCRLRLAVDDGAVEVEVADDGRGLDASTRAGVGLSSMQERAAELGGRCRVEPVAPSGTRVLARLPLTREASWTPSAP
jgi:signal transduction histidine kinase